MGNSRYRAITTLALVAMAGGLAFLGRLGLDELIGIAPDWAGVIERFGGWALGMAVGLLVVLPVFRMYGVFDQGKSSSRDDEAPRERGAKAEGMKRRR